MKRFPEYWRFAQTREWFWPINEEQRKSRRAWPKLIRLMKSHVITELWLKHAAPDNNPYKIAVPVLFVIKCYYEDGTELDLMCYECLMDCYEPMLKPEEVLHELL